MQLVGTRPNRGLRRKSIEIESDGAGLLFVNGGGRLAGAMRIGAETFQVTAEPGKGAAGQAYWKIVGDGDEGDGIHGVAFNESGGVTQSGTLRPRLTGKVVTVVCRIERRLAGWLRRSESTHFYSVRLTGDTLNDRGTLPLPFGESGGMRDMSSA